MADLHLAVDLPVQGASAGAAAFAEAEGEVIVHQFLGGQFQEVAVIPDKAAHVNFGQLDVELVALKFMKVIPRILVASAASRMEIPLRLRASSRRSPIVCMNSQ